LAALDSWLFFLINQSWHRPWLDAIMVHLSGETLWVSLFVAVLLWAFYLKNWPAVITCLLVAVAMGLSDAFAYNVLKPFFGRLRPCHELETVRIVAGCGGRMSFPSNHAANGMAAVMTLWFAGYLRWARPLLFLIVLVGFSRVYLGVHYPGDILFGFVVGTLMAVIVVFTGEQIGLSFRARPPAKRW